MELFGTKTALIFLILAVAVTKGQNDKPGEPCDAFGACKNNLVCPSNVCECAPGKHFSPDFGTPGECRLNVGETCDPLLDECGGNANCPTVTPPATSTCQCNTNYEPDSNSGLCRRKNSCQYDTDCTAIGQYMVCDNNACKCRTGQVFNAIAQQCEVAYGGACAAGNDPPCDGDTTCNTAGTCACKDPAAQPNAVGKCVLPAGARCDISDDKCDPTAFLSCDSSNECACASSDAVYSDEAKACQILAEKVCDANSGPRCTPGATCNAGKCTCDTGVPAFNGECGCPTGYDVWNYYGTLRCSKKPGSACSKNDDCDPNAVCSTTSATCSCKTTYDYDVSPINGFCFVPHDGVCMTSSASDCEPGMECVRSVCACPSGETYDKRSQICKTALTEACIDDSECITGATCQSRKCACGTGFQQNGTICVGTLNMGCVDNTDCNAGVGLSCNTMSSTCQCQADKYTFQTSANRCVVRAGQICSETTDVCESGFSCLAWNTTVNGVPVSETVCLCNADITGSSPLCSGSDRAVAVTLLMAIAAAVSTYLAV